MKFTTITTLVYPLLSFMSLAVFAAPLESRDVYAPRITYPIGGETFYVDECVTLTWDTSDAPSQITNEFGSQIYLVKGQIILLEVPGPLAQDFDILLGEEEIKIPEVVDGDDYQFVLFGDSGDDSPVFSIKHRNN